MSPWLYVFIAFLLIVIVIFIIVWATFTGTMTTATTKPLLLPLAPEANADGLNVIQFWNNTNVTLLLGILGPINISGPIMPAEGTLVMQPGQTLTLTIPQSWENTAATGTPYGPRFWAREGCHYDTDVNKAQCLIGDCGGQYNCAILNANNEYVPLAGKAPVSLAEMCFNCGDGYTYYDVSLVDGYSLNIDIDPLDKVKQPGVPTNDPHWNLTGICSSDVGLRATCPTDWQLKASQLGSYIPEGVDYTVACFSNCGKYEYPVAPDGNCDPSDPKCANWRKYCCQQLNVYDNACTNNSQCGDAVCWLRNGTQNCQCSGFQVGSTPCPANVCTFPDAQPPLQQCSAGECIGDDTLHAVCPYAYTWPNDPQTHFSNSKRWRITFSAPDQYTTPLPDSVNNFPVCSTLPAEFNYPQAIKECGVNSVGLAGAKGRNATNPSWDCSLTMDVNKAPSTEGVICRW